MGRTKPANANAMRNNNAKQMEKRSNTEFASYAEVEVKKMHHGKKTK
ncbi:hypothetical protein WD019_09215 [Fictibacillus sp. Mic-4]